MLHYRYPDLQWNRQTYRRIYLHTIIKNINVNLAAKFHIITVNQRINKNLMYGLSGDIPVFPLYLYLSFSISFFVLFFINSIPFCKRDITSDPLYSLSSTSIIPMPYPIHTSVCRIDKDLYRRIGDSSIYTKLLHLLISRFHLQVQRNKV